MRFTSTVLLSLAGTALAAPAPVPEPKKGHWSVPARLNQNFRPSGALAMERAFHKFHIPIPKELRQTCAKLKAAHKAKRSSGSAVAKSVEGDMQYVVPVSIGTPPQVLNLDFDTGSADLWVISSLLPSSSKAGHNVFTSTKSSTFQNGAGMKWQITYGDQSSASGTVGFDKVTVGGVTVAKQAVELAQTASSQFVQDTSSDGLLGLAFGSINTVTPSPQKTFFENAMGDLDKKLFCADLRHNEDGAYDFGKIETSKYKGAMNYVPIDSSGGFWQFKSASFKVGNGKVQAADNNQAIADTGTTLLLVSEKVADAYYASVSTAKMDNSQGGYTYPCGTKLPSFTVYIDGYALTIPGTDLDYAPITEGSSTCFGGLQGIPSSIGSGSIPMIFGDTFLKQIYAVFDMSQSKPRFGFAVKAGASAIITGPNGSSPSTGGGNDGGNDNGGSNGGGDNGGSDGGSDGGDGGDGGNDSGDNGDPWTWPWGDDPWGDDSDPWFSGGDWFNNKKRS